MSDMKKDMFGLIMAGGAGTRFWPLSRKSRPKQFLPLLENGCSLYQKSCERIAGSVIKWENIYVVTSEQHVEYINEQTPLIKRENILLEPAGKNTAPCAGYAASVISRRTAGEPVIAILPADHIITEEDVFRQHLNSAYNAVKDGTNIVTIGINPTRAETGYGYIEKGEKNNHIKNMFSSLRFVEKPDKDKAVEYLERGNFLWNAGMFVMKAKSLLNSFKEFLPQMYQPMIKLGEIVDRPKGWQEVEKIYNQLNSVSLDYGIMEKAEDISVIEAEMGWSDLGSWESFANFLLESGRLEALSGENISVNSSGNLIIGTNRIITTCGIENTVIVDTGDALLVAKLDASQDVKLVVEELRRQGKKNLL